ncbi:fas-associated death domain protein [Odontomachus brunneus]|uniref:fas-associated death domain protein n=1 Tax=Odontomachus brunneus TaxID=486640 RepID=UPI0013F28205|nr:fas-associated death domain protein [Odontomachus brunneus]
MLERYKSLRQDFLSVAEPSVDSNILNQLKCNYAHEIDSKRKLSKAKDFETFIRLLEKRDIISCNNIEQLYFISRYIGKPELKDKLLEYENWKMQTAPPFPYYNMYQSDDISVPLQNYENVTSTFESYGACSSTQVLHGSTIQNLNLSFGHTTKKYHSEQEEGDNKRKSLQQAVLLQISERIGRSWRDVVRHLGIRECEIDAVQSKYPCDLKEQSFKILKTYISQSDKEWAINLIRALEKGRRKDLKELVENLMVTYKDI